jgi:hypothetical protein
MAARLLCCRGLEKAENEKVGGEPCANQVRAATTNITDPTKNCGAAELDPPVRLLMSTGVGCAEEVVNTSRSQRYLLFTS